MYEVPTLCIFENRGKIVVSQLFFLFFVFFWWWCFYIFIAQRLLDLEPGCSFLDAVSLQFRKRISVIG